MRDAAYKPMKPGFRRHVQTPAERLKRKQQYRKNKRKESQQAKRRYKQYKNNPSYKRKRQQYLKNPNRHKMLRSPKRTASTAVPVFGRFDAPYWVGAWDGDWFEVETPDGLTVLVSPAVLLRTFSFVEESDLDLIESMIDADDFIVDDSDVDAALMLHGLDVEALPDDPVEALDAIGELVEPNVTRVAWLIEQAPASSQWSRDRKDTGHEVADTAQRSWKDKGEGQWTTLDKDHPGQPTPSSVDVNDGLFGVGTGKVIPTAMKTASKEELRTFLNVHHPIYHACTMRQFFRALRFGLRADGLYPELEGVRGIPFTENLALLQGNPYARPIILVYDWRELARTHTIEDSLVTDGVGGTLQVLPSGFIHHRMLRGFIAHNRLYMARSRFLPLEPEFPVARVRVPTSPEYGM